jgi:hypothetical protein
MIAMYVDDPTIFKHLAWFFGFLAGVIVYLFIIATIAYLAASDIRRTAKDRIMDDGDVDGGETDHER